jgi:hypothetical protein
MLMQMIEAGRVPSCEFHGSQLWRRTIEALQGGCSCSIEEGKRLHSWRWIRLPRGSSQDCLKE